MESNGFPHACHQPVTQKLDELLKVTTRLETEAKSVNDRLTKIENKIDKNSEEYSKTKTTVSHLVSFANNNKEINKKIIDIVHDIDSLKEENDNHKSKWAKRVENVYQICFILLSVILPILLVKMGFGQ